MEEALRFADQIAKDRRQSKEKSRVDRDTNHRRNVQIYVENKLKKLDINKIRSKMVEITEKGQNRYLIMRVPLISSWSSSLFHKLSWEYSDHQGLLSVLESMNLKNKIRKILNYHKIDIYFEHQHSGGVGPWSVGISDEILVNMHWRISQQ